MLVTLRKRNTTFTIYVFGIPINVVPLPIYYNDPAFNIIVEFFAKREIEKQNIAQYYTSIHFARHFRTLLAVPRETRSKFRLWVCCIDLFEVSGVGLNFNRNFGVLSGGWLALNTRADPPNGTRGNVISYMYCFSVGVVLFVVFNYQQPPHQHRRQITPLLCKSYCAVSSRCNRIRLFVVLRRTNCRNSNSNWNFIVKIRKTKNSILVTGFTNDFGDIVSYTNFHGGLSLENK